LTAAVTKPRYTHKLTDRQPCDTSSQILNAPDIFIVEYQWLPNIGKLAINDMQVSAAGATGTGFVWVSPTPDSKAEIGIMLINAGCWKVDKNQNYAKQVRERTPLCRKLRFDVLVLDIDQARVCGLRWNSMNSW
jgi:hypothetical protein